MSERRHAFGDADDDRHSGVGRLKDGVRGERARARRSARSWRRSRRTASFTVSNTGTPSAVSPPRPGVTPATTFVPYSMQRRVWKLPSLPVMPWTTRRVLESTRMLTGLSPLSASGTVARTRGRTQAGEVLVPGCFGSGRLRRVLSPSPATGATHRDAPKGVEAAMLYSVSGSSGESRARL